MGALMGFEYFLLQLLFPFQYFFIPVKPKGKLLNNLKFESNEVCFPFVYKVESRLSLKT